MKAVMKKTILIGVAAVAPAAFLQGCRGGDKAKTDEDKANLRKQNNPVQSGKQSEDEAKAREAESEGLRSAIPKTSDAEFAALNESVVKSTAPASAQEKSSNQPDAPSASAVAPNDEDEAEDDGPAAEAGGEGERELELGDDEEEEELLEEEDVAPVEDDELDDDQAKSQRQKITDALNETIRQHEESNAKRERDLFGPEGMPDDFKKGDGQFSYGYIFAKELQKALKDKGFDVPENCLSLRTEFGWNFSGRACDREADVDRLVETVEFGPVVEGLRDAETGEIDQNAVSELVNQLRSSEKSAIDKFVQYLTRRPWSFGWHAGGSYRPPAAAGLDKAAAAVLEQLNEEGDIDGEDGDAPEGDVEDEEDEEGAVPQQIEGDDSATPAPEAAVRAESRPKEIIGDHTTYSFGADNPKRVVALFLGLNTTIDDLMEKDADFVSGLPQDSDDTRFILVQAANKNVEGVPMPIPSWFPHLVPNGDQDLEGPSQFVLELLDTIKQDYGVERNMVHLMGISQGGAVALWAGSKLGVTAITSILGFWPSFESHVPTDGAVQNVHHVNFLSSPKDQFFQPTRGNELSKLELQRGFGGRLNVQEVNQLHEFNAPITTEMREAVLECLKTWKDASEPPALPTQAERDNLYAQIGALRPEVQQKVLENVQQKIGAMVQEKGMEMFGNLLAGLAGGPDSAGNGGNPLGDMLAGFAADPRQAGSPTAGRRKPAHAGTIRAGGF